MSDRFNALTVVFEQSLREEDVKPMMDAILMIRGVLSVEGVQPENISDYVADIRAKHEIRQKLYDLANSLNPFPLNQPSMSKFNLTPAERETLANSTPEQWIEALNEISKDYEFMRELGAIVVQGFFNGLIRGLEKN